jgi:hypothetical protein
MLAARFVGYVAMQRMTQYARSSQAAYALITGSFDGTNCIEPLLRR